MLITSNVRKTAPVLRSEPSDAGNLQVFLKSNALRILSILHLLVLGLASILCRHLRALCAALAPAKLSLWPHAPLPSVQCGTTPSLFVSIPPAVVRGMTSQTEKLEN